MNMKKIKFFILLCLFGMISIGAGAEVVNGTCGKNANWSFNTETGKLSITGNGDMEDYYMTTLSDLPNCPWNNYLSSISSLDISNQITSIGSYAFYNCLCLENVNVPNSVTSIGTYAFYKCQKLSSVTFGNSLRNIKNAAFQGCKSLSSIIIPNSMDSIGSNVFCNCEILNEISIGNGITYIRNNAFDKTGWYNNQSKGLLILGTYLLGYKGSIPEGEMNIPEGVETIADYAFSSCVNITSVSIPFSLKRICAQTFSGCRELVSANIKDIDKWSEIEGGGLVFGSAYSAGKLTGVYKNGELINDVILNNVTKIGYMAFAYNATISTIKLPENTTSIGRLAFSDCKSLTKISIPKSISIIGNDAFRYCTSLNEVHIEDINTWVYIDFENEKANPLYYAKHLYMDNKLLTDVMLSNVTQIKKYSFYNSEGILSIRIPKSVQYIGEYAFNGFIPEIYVDWDIIEEFADIEPTSFLSTYKYSGTLYVPNGCKGLYTSHENWKNFKYIYEGKIFIKNMDNSNDYIGIAQYDNLLLSDNIKSISIAEGINIINVTYTRNFEKNGVWQGWYMPFDVDFDDMKGAYDVAQIHGVLLDKDKNAVLAFLKLDEGTVKANTPYVVRPKTSGEVAITTTTDLQPTQPSSFLMMSATDKYNIGGVYEQTTTPGNWYALNLDGQFQKMDTGVYLRPFRIYMTIDPRKDNPYATSVNTNAKMDIVVLGDDETTGITSYENDNDNENLKAMTKGEGAIYNLNGQRVASIVSGQIYIMNGKKYIAK